MEQAKLTKEDLPWTPIERLVFDLQALEESFDMLFGHTILNVTAMQLEDSDLARLEKTGELNPLFKSRKGLEQANTIIDKTFELLSHSDIFKDGLKEELETLKITYHGTEREAPLIRNTLYSLTATQKMLKSVVEEEPKILASLKLLLEKNKVENIDDPFLNQLFPEGYSKLAQILLDKFGEMNESIKLLRENLELVQKL